MNGIQQVENCYFVGSLESEKEDRTCEVRLLFLFETPACKVSISVYHWELNL